MSYRYWKSQRYGRSIREDKLTRLARKKFNDFGYKVKCVAYYDDDTGYRYAVAWYLCMGPQRQLLGRNYHSAWETLMAMDEPRIGPWRRIEPWRVLGAIDVG